MKKLMVIFSLLFVGITASAYQYQTFSGVRFVNDAGVHKCWGLKVWDVSAANLRKHHSEIESKLLEECRANGGAGWKRCAPLHGALSCQTSEDCTRVYRACIKSLRRDGQ